MKVSNLIALSAALLFSAGTLQAVRSSDHSVPVRINGLTVAELPAVNVTASAAEKRAAALLVNVPQVVDLRAVQVRPIEAFGLIEPVLAMPYYSFGLQPGQVSKD